MTKKLYKYKKPISIDTIKRISNILIGLGVILFLLGYGPIIKDEIWYKYKSVKSQEFTLEPGGEQDSVFARLLSSKPITIEPVDKEFSIVIEKLGVNAPVVRDVSVTDSVAYLEALKSGVAHASVSQYPSDKPGNVYLFAHASSNFWRLGKYATVFNLLRKLEMGDKIHIFFENKEFVYTVVNSEVYEGWETYPITRPVIEPILTLQTCDPPGTTLNRLVVTAKLTEIK